ncbi:MAG: mandelate racemase [Planctomycetota bacterium]|nr:mandelate racemase [Planctomycetota bacterium]
MRVRIRDVRFGVSDCPTRLPFRFGINTMTWAPTLTARVELDTDAGSAVGFAADLLVPKWFEKDPQKSLEDDVRGLMASAVAAAGVAKDPGSDERAETVFDLWWRTYQARVHSQPVDASDRLLRGFGVALVERAVLDAACRAAGATFFEALKTDLFGIRPRVLYPELEGWNLADSLPPEPLARVALRHTVGLVDALCTSDIPAGTRVGDGLPEALEEDIAAFGLDWFKLKLCGDPAVDLPRCLAFAEVLGESASDDRRLTVDGNEQFASLDALAAFLTELGRDPRGADLLERLVCIEQPLARARSLDAGLESGLAALARFAPVILDEADHGIEALPRALDLGYGGISVKNCKGVLRALVGRGLCERRGAIQSAEDLTNLGVLALQQDLCTVAALGLPHVERNGHHYFPGLDHLPPAEALSAAMLHPSLWTRDANRTSLRIEGGRLDLSSLQTVGYGYASEIDWDARTPLEDWTFRPPKA